MYMLQNVPLGSYSTMRLGGLASFLTDINDKSEIAEAVEWAEQRKLPVIMIGQGSNIIWSDGGFPGLVLVNKITGFDIFNEDEDNLYLTVGAGEIWDKVVVRTVEMGYTGIEFLSLIPGTTGATPIQNVGAYGREIAEVLVAVEAFDRQKKQIVNVAPSDCAFGYRTSRFKTTDKGRFLITSITLHLLKDTPRPPFYPSLVSFLKEHGIKEYTPKVIRDAVVAIRQSKLPDPTVVANNGSFFANPVVPQYVVDELLADNPTLVYWRLPKGQAKISAAWLVETAGFKDIHDTETGMATWPTQSLVLVNEQAKSTAQLLAFRQKIITKVQQLFNITLEQEPELIGV